MAMMDRQGRIISLTRLRKNLNITNKISNNLKSMMFTVHRNIWILKINLNLESQNLESLVQIQMISYLQKKVKGHLTIPSNNINSNIRIKICCTRISKQKIINNIQIHKNPQILLTCGKQRQITTKMLIMFSRNSKVLLWIRQGS